MRASRADPSPEPTRRSSSVEPDRPVYRNGPDPTGASASFATDFAGTIPRPGYENTAGIAANGAPSVTSSVRGPLATTPLSCATPSWPCAAA